MMTYLELLNNGQIIKKGEICKQDYINCGTIDTLEQKLCVKINEKCPLYDVRINPDNEIIASGNYQTDKNRNSNIYYNNENYNEENKKIIGKLLLNDGQPCYNLNEQLWRKFNDDEAGDEHLKCDLEIFGKKTDERYEKVGEISYKKIYDDNLIDGKSRDLFNDIDPSKKLSLYKRVFLGVDKECNDKSGLFWENYDKLKTSQNQEKNLLLAEAIIIFCLICLFIVFGIVISKSKSRNEERFFIVVGIIFILSFISFIICGSVFLGRMAQYNDLSYECRDSITNEVLKESNSNTNKQIVYTAINLGIDILSIIFNIIAFTYEKIVYFFKYDFHCCSCNCDCVCPCKKKSKYAVSSSNQKISNDKYIIEDPTNLDAPEGVIPYKEVIVNQNLPNPLPSFNQPMNPPAIFADSGVPNPAQYPSLEEINNQILKK